MSRLLDVLVAPGTVPDCQRLAAHLTTELPAVVVRGTGEKTKCLLAEARWTPGVWVLPKGRLHPTRHARCGPA